MHEAVTIFTNAIDEVKAALTNEDRPTLPLDMEKWEPCLTYGEEVGRRPGREWWLVKVMAVPSVKDHEPGVVLHLPMFCFLWARKRDHGHERPVK